MNGQISKAQLFLYWITPTAVQATSYVFLTLLTILVCSQDFIDKLLFASGDFNPIRAAIGGVDLLLTLVVGEKIAGSISLAVFWGLVGIIVNLIWWGWSSFSTELNNDIVFSKYVHPQDADPNSQLRDFIKRTVVRSVVAIIGILYLNFVLSRGWPSISNTFAETMNNWSKKPDMGAMVFTAVSEILMLHLLVVFTRLVLLRRRDTSGVG